MTDIVVFTKLTEPGQKTGGFTFRTVPAGSSFIDTLALCGSAYSAATHNLTIKAAKSQDATAIDVAEAQHETPIAALVGCGYNHLHFKVTKTQGTEDTFPRVASLT